MKASVPVTLIICGALLFALPYLSNYLGIRQVAATMSALNKPVNLNGNLSKGADTVCMLMGSLMILVGMVAGLRASGRAAG